MRPPDIFKSVKKNLTFQILAGGFFLRIGNDSHLFAIRNQMYIFNTVAHILHIIMDRNLLRNP